jgi:hypothetical protein
MADVTVRARDELDVMTQRGPLGASSTSAEFAIVGVGSKDNDAQFAVSDRRLGRCNLRRQSDRGKRGRRDSGELEIMGEEKRIFSARSRRHSG